MLAYQQLMRDSDSLSTNDTRKKNDSQPFFVSFGVKIGTKIPPMACFPG
jgi:hypothetical protein